MSNPPRDTANIALPQGFVFGQVEPIAARSVNLTAERMLPPAAFAPPLGALAAFTGTFVGKGFNTIFRPDNTITPTKFPNPIGVGNPRDNVLELNLTEESLDFSKPLGSVPNRGANTQGDIMLNGVTYLQTINDVTTPGVSVGIHVEPGIWMAVPSSSTPALPATVTRMASIPHGTTINAQGFVTPAVAGKPTILPVDITPTLLQGGKPFRFKSQTASLKDTPRIPQDLTPFIAAGTITQALLDDPNTLLRSHLSGQTVVSTTTITVASTPPPPLFAGGIDNIAFLVGDPVQTVAKENANAVRMTSTFWIETVQYVLNIPVRKRADPPLMIQGTASVPGQPVPTFQIELSADVTAPRTVTVTSTQIQYSQIVFLNFAPLTWPHVSVATLVPATPIVVKV